MVSELIGAIASADFDGILIALDQGGWIYYIFPLLLVYALLFTILEKVELFRGKKPIKVIISFIMAFFAATFSIPLGSDPMLGTLMRHIFPGVTAFSIAILALYIVGAMLGVDITKFFGDGEDNNKYIMYILGGLGAILVGYFIFVGFGVDFRDNIIVRILRDPLVWIIVGFGLLMKWITSDSESEENVPEDPKLQVNVGGAQGDK